MAKNKIVFWLFATLLLLISFKYLDPIKGLVLNYSHNAQIYIILTKNKLYNKIKTHFNQVKQIEELQKQVDILKPSSFQVVTFATKLNQLLDESNLTKFNPMLKLSRTISYEKLDNPLRIWLEVPNYNPNKEYGLIFNGYTAGIIYEKYNKPLAHLQLDKKVVFSVLVGKSKQIAVIFGNGSNLIIKHIPSQTEIKVGDQVVTSGKDGLFYEGIKVGEISDIKKENNYLIATITPYMTNKRPNFFYAIDLNNTIIPN
jgi:rod shape-determining protein MreC